MRTTSNLILFGSFALLALALTACDRKQTEPSTGKAKTSYGQAVERARDLSKEAEKRAEAIDDAVKNNP